MEPLSRRSFKPQKPVKNVWGQELIAWKVSEIVELVELRDSHLSKEETCMDNYNSLKESVHNAKVLESW
jgi:hypothetical protein